MGIVIFIVFFTALLLSVPIGIALGVSALAGLVYISFDPDFFIFLPQKFMAGLDSFTLLAIPFFILAGAIMSYGGIARRIVDLTLVFFGRIRCGLGIVVTISTFFFRAICGSGSAKTAAIGSVMFPEMKRNKYPDDFSTALFASAGGHLPLCPHRSTSSLSALWQISLSAACSLPEYSHPLSMLSHSSQSCFFSQKSLISPWHLKLP